MRVGGARPPPLITFTLTSKVAVYAPAEWADTLFISTYICTLWQPLPAREGGGVTGWESYFMTLKTGS